MKSSNQIPAVTQFISEIEQVPWFDNLGRPPQQDGPAAQIHAWEEWSGPEEPSVIGMHERQQAFYDELTNGETSTEMRELWEQIQSIVFPIRFGQSAVCSRPGYMVCNQIWQSGMLPGRPVLLAYTCLQSVPYPTSFKNNRTGSKLDTGHVTGMKLFPEQ
ncbi:hypothetical protein Pan153_02340 [Gimesia panareensis]|uniref:Uncharacterized protein n=1 Tax=Gimesia panareensis TaxID=2527978 RepID=A0A518FH00_9PLAN|nr:hypothetical protein [Gimesia panareensis]QDV15618.1 hypothetical protein Pan153_02340 [Gimesia panareensis]